MQRGRKSEHKWSKASSSEDELEKEAKERVADLKERDEYANRVRDRDKDRTKKIMSKSEQKVHQTPTMLIMLYNLNNSSFSVILL